MACAPPPEKKRADKQVGGEEAPDSQRDDVVESNRRTDADKDNEHGKDGCDNNGVDGQTRPGCNMRNETPAGDAMIARKGPEHA